MKEENLIFIVSQPRSGSTLLQNLLSNNAQTNTTSEPWVMLGLAPLISPSLVTAKYDHTIAMDAMAEYENKFEVNVKKEVRNLALRLYQPLFDGYSFAIDKTPRYWEILDELIEMFPKSKFIILRRDPINVVQSIIKTWDIKSVDRLKYFRRDLEHGPKAIHRFTQKHKDNENVYSLRFEDLISNTEGIINQLYSWIGLEFDKSVLDTSENIKYKGKYGDPYQNSNEGYESTKNSSPTKLERVLQKFILGYGFFLGKTFLQEYGYQYNPKNKRTIAFSYFMQLGEYQKEKITCSLKSKLVLKCKKLMM